MSKEKKYMQEVLKEANKAFLEDEVPIGAIIVKDNKIIGRGYNKKENKNDITNHAEIIAIRKASRKIKDWRLDGCLLFVNMEPCVMCMGAIIESRIKKIKCGIKNNKYHESIKLLSKEYDIEIEYGHLKNESDDIIKSFFKNKRKK